MEDTCVLCVAGLYLEVCSAIYTYTLNNFRHCYVPSAVFIKKKYSLLHINLQVVEDMGGHCAKTE